MSAMPIQAIQARLAELAMYDRIALERATVKELRDLSRGVIPDCHKLKKPDLVEAIIQATSETRAALGKFVETKAAVEPQGSPVERAKVIYADLRDIATTSQTNEEEIDRVSRLFGRFTRYEGSSYAVSTQKSNRTVIKKELQAALKNESGRQLPLIVATVGRFLRLYDSWLSEAVSELNAGYAAKVAETHKALNEAKGLAKMFETAKAVLADPSGHHWAEVSKAIALATGRRMAEVHSSGMFELVDQHTLRFSGQLKTKGRQDAPEAYEIPCLLDATQVRDAVDYLASIGRRAETAAEADAKFSKPLSRAMAGSGMTYKDLRAIYAEVASRRYWVSPERSGISKDAYFARILGHGSTDIQTALSYQKYKLDEVYEVLEMLP